MKQNMTLQRWFSTAVVGLALAGSATLGLAQNTNTTFTFDDENSTKSFVQWWGGGGAGATMTWDNTLDAAGDPLSGSVRYEANFVGNSGEQFMTFFTIANRWGWDGGYVLDATTYTNLSFDLKVDPSTGQRKNNADFGWLEIGLVTYVTDWGTTALPGRTIPLTATNWTHFDYPLQASLGNLDKVVGFFIKMWSDGGHTNSLIFNVDNFMISKPTAPVVIPPPTVRLTSSGPAGVQVIMDDDSSQWQRNGISTPASSGPYLWTAQGSYPVSYSCTIADFPDAATHPGFEAHMYLVNRDTATSNDETSGSPDWGVPDLLLFRVENRAAGDALAQIQWKTNFPGANATNIPVAVVAPSALGTWTIMFTDSTHGTLTGPGIAATNFTLPEDAVLNNFSPTASFIQFGMFKNDGTNDGHNNQVHGTFSKVTFTGAAAAFVDDFTGATLTSKYAWRKTSSTAVQHIPPGTQWILDWTLPASADSYVSTKATLDGAWADPGLINIIQVNTRRQVFVPTSALPSANAGFFALRKRQYAKLQVLLPGETAAPGTPTGKTGTPDEQYAGAPLDIIINAVDANWYVVKSVTNMVNVTCSDPFAYIPQDAPFVNGTVKFSVTVGNPGMTTFTASDVTDPTKTPNTSTQFKAN